MKFENKLINANSFENQVYESALLRDQKFPKKMLASVESLNLKGAKIDLANCFQHLEWCQNEFGLPNFILRSPLFKALQRNSRSVISQREIKSLDGTVYYATGPVLNQSDLDVLIGFIRMSYELNFDNLIEFNERTFLSLINRGGLKGNIGKSDREWLRNTITRLCLTVLTFKSDTYEYGGSLILQYFRDGLKGHYVISLNPQFIKLFKLDNWTKLNINIRNSLRGNPLAQFLYGYFHSNASTFPLKIQTLHNISGSEAGASCKTEAGQKKALNGWRDDTLRPALNILQKKLSEHGLSFEWAINDNNLVKVKHQPSKSQNRNLYKNKRIKPLNNRFL